jgi:molecular chaperone GrpE
VTPRKVESAKEERVAENAGAPPQEQVEGPGDTLSQGPSTDLDEGSDPTGLTPEPAPGLLARVTAERDEYLDLLQRAKADFENYRKRAAREHERLVAHAHERLVRELLPVLDDLERAAKPPIRDSELDRGNHVEVPPTELDTIRSEYDALVDGVKLVERSLRRTLQKEGLAEIATDGLFDPHVHEALLTQAKEGAESGSVLEVVQRGYRLGDKVVRPARVIVAE